MYTYYILFYFLDICYTEMRGEIDDDVAGLLGAMSPDLWSDGLPIDMACVERWDEIENANEDKSVIEKICLYLKSYETDFGFSCKKVMSFIHSQNDNGENLLKEAEIRATRKCEQIDVQ